MEMTKQPAMVSPKTALGPSVPEPVLTYVHAYGDSRADEDGLSALRVAETVLALRRWAAQLQAAERERLLALAIDDAQRLSEQARVSEANGLRAFIERVRA